MWFQDESIEALRAKQGVRPATRNFRLQWGPSKSANNIADVSTQAYIPPHTSTMATMTNPKYLGLSAAEIRANDLEHLLAEKQKQIK